MQLNEELGRYPIIKLVKMKRFILSASFFLGLGMIGFAQQTENKVSTLQIYKMETSESDTELAKQQEIEQCKSLLEALAAKEAWIRSNPEELKTATEAGWFEDAAATRAKLEARIKELESK